MAPVPDKLSLWPPEGGVFGLEVTFEGATGYEHASAHERRLRELGLRYTFRQELGGGWTIRLGPLTADAADAAVGSFLWPERLALPAPEGAPGPHRLRACCSTARSSRATATRSASCSRTLGIAYERHEPDVVDRSNRPD